MAWTTNWNSLSPQLSITWIPVQNSFNLCLFLRSSSILRVSFMISADVSFISSTLLSSFSKFSWIFRCICLISKLILNSPKMHAWIGKITITISGTEKRKPFKLMYSSVGTFSNRANSFLFLKARTKNQASLDNKMIIRYIQRNWRLIPATDWYRSSIDRYLSILLSRW